MTAFDAVVRRAVADEQPDLLEHAEHCSADPGALAGIGRGVGHQVRVRAAAGGSPVALYTVSQARDEQPEGVVRMGRGGRERLGATDSFAAVVHAVVPRPDLDDADAERLHEFVERLDDDGVSSGLIALAPHGGHIERHTDAQAERVAARLRRYGVSAWRCRGFGPAGGGAYQRFHITSTDLHEASFPGLAAVAGRGFRHAVAFHGCRTEEVLVGGGASFPLKAEVASSIEEALGGAGIPVRIAAPCDVFGGDDPRNLVNRLTLGGCGGVHLEQGLRARAEHGREIADAVARVFLPRLSRRSRGPRWWRRLRRYLRPSGR